MVVSHTSLDISRVEALQRLLADGALIGFETLHQPLDRIVIARFPDATCAIRFVASADASTEDKRNRSAEYEVLELKPARDTVVQGRVADKGWVGLGHWGWRRGKHSIPCGKQSLRWRYPTGLGFPEGGQLAPTSWTDFSQVRHDLAESSWYSLDATQQRRLLQIPIDELP